MSNEPRTKHEQNYDECRFCDVPWSSHGVNGGPPLPYEPPDATRSYWQTKSNEPSTPKPDTSDVGEPVTDASGDFFIDPVNHRVACSFRDDADCDCGLIDRLRAIEAEALAASRAETAALREAAQRLCDAYADLVATNGLTERGMLGWKDQQDADDAFMCALQDTRTALDGRERPHRHVGLVSQ